MTLSPFEQDRLRLAAFAGLERLIDLRGGFATHSELLHFQLEGRQFGLIDQSRGIRNPKDLDETLSIVASEDGPYPDYIDEAGLLHYSFRTGDPHAGDNRKLRAAWALKKPLIVFRKPLPNVYVPIVPSFVVGEDLRAGSLLIALGESSWRSFEVGAEDPAIDKQYVAQVVQRRVHQPVFRARVIVAYSHTCAVCKLNHPELLDAAHIIPDRHEDGVAHVTNGMALCKIHHAAYDNGILGVSPDYVVHIDREVLEEVDGPMLKHGIQEMNGVSLTLPAQSAHWPSREALALRFESFVS